MIDFDAETLRLAHDFDARTAEEPDPDPPDEEREDDEQAAVEGEERDDLSADGRRGYDGRWDEDDDDETARMGGEG